MRTTASPEYPGFAMGPLGRGAVLAQNAELPELARADLVEEISADQGVVSAIAIKAVSPLPGAAIATLGSTF
jgi:hypothetical protein